MNSKQAKALRKAINEQFPNKTANEKKQIYKDGKKQFAELNHTEKGGLIVMNNNIPKGVDK
jgi:hypothetical protein